MTNKSIYNFKTPKSGNEETSFFNIKGRINRRTFFLRLAFTFTLFIISTFLYFKGYFGEYDSREFIFFETIHIYILPVFILIFNLVQGAKRMHDVNKSGWYCLVPLYNLYLIFSPGSTGNNDYGLDPTPIKNVRFFDEIKNSANNTTSGRLNEEENKSGLEKWREHLDRVKREYPNKPYKEVFEIARNTYSPSNSPSQENTKFVPKKQSIWPVVTIVLIVWTSLYLIFNSNSPAIDSDGDGIPDSEDACPQEFGNYSLYSTSGCPDSDSDGIVDENDDCPTVYGNEENGCFYFKKVVFTNMTNSTADLCIAYQYEGDWICEGWFPILANSNDTINLPRFFSNDEVYWFARNDNWEEWTGNSKSFYVEEDGYSVFKIKNGSREKSGGGYKVKKRFHKLILTDAVTDHGFSN